MKKCLLKYLFLLPLALVGCASTQKSTIQEQPTEPKIEIPLFDDWKYKGFGNELPETANIIVFDNNKEITFAEDDKNERIIASGIGIDADQAINQAHANLTNSLALLKETKEDFDFKNYTLIDDTWVRINQEFLQENFEEETNISKTPYIAYIIYQLKTESIRE